MYSLQIFLRTIYVYKIDAKKKVKKSQAIGRLGLEWAVPWASQATASSACGPAISNVLLGPLDPPGWSPRPSDRPYPVALNVLSFFPHRGWRLGHDGAARRRRPPLPRRRGPVLPLQPSAPAEHTPPHTRRTYASLQQRHHP
jgi:hypothetical protein